jgi:hypothetical protein
MNDNWLSEADRHRVLKTFELLRARAALLPRNDPERWMRVYVAKKYEDLLRILDEDSDEAGRIMDAMVASGEAELMVKTLELCMRMNNGEDVREQIQAIRQRLAQLQE